MIEKKVRKRPLNDKSAAADDLAYWMSKTPEERIAAVEYLRNQFYGHKGRPRFSALLALLNAHHVEYMIVGGHALALHGSPRFTGDLDVYYKADAVNAERMATVIAEFGFGDLGLTADDFLTAESVLQLGVPPLRLDFLNSLTGVSWDEAYAGRVNGTYGDIQVHYIGRDQFIKNKRATGRQRDLADLEMLEGI